MRKLLSKYKEIPTQVKAAFWFMMCSFLQKGIAVITTPIFTRLLSTEDYGRLNVFNAWYGILSIFVTLCLSYGVFSQGIVKFEKDKDRFASSLQGLSTTLVLFWLLVYLLFRKSWNRLFTLSTVEMLALLTMCWSSAAFYFWAVEQRTDYQYRSLVLMTLGISFTESLLAIIAVLNTTYKFEARILSFMLVELAAGVYCFLRHEAKGKRFFDFAYWKYAVFFCVPLIPHYLSQTVLNNSDRIMIERMVSLDKAGIYGIAYSISMLMTVFNTALAQTISPWMFKKIRDGTPQDIAPVAYGSLAFIAAVNLCLIALAPEVVRIFAPPEYSEAIWAIPPVAMSSYLLFMYDYFARFEFYYEKTLGIMLASIFGAVLNVVLNYLCIRRWGYLAAAYTTLLCYLVYVLCHYYFMSRICRQYEIKPKIYDTRVLVGLTLALIVLGFSIMATYTVTWLRYTILALGLLAAAVRYKSLVELLKRFLSLRKA